MFFDRVFTFTVTLLINLSSMGHFYLFMHMFCGYFIFHSFVILDLWFSWSNLILQILRFLYFFYFAGEIFFYAGLCVYVQTSSSSRNKIGKNEEGRSTLVFYERNGYYSSSVFSNIRSVIIVKKLLMMLFFYLIADTLGSLEFSLLYKPVMNALHCTIHRAKVSYIQHHFQHACFSTMLLTLWLPGRGACQDPDILV